MYFLIKTGRAFYATALIVYGLQQFYFGTFRNVFFSPYQDHLPLLRLFAYLFGAYLIITAVLIFMERKGRQAALVLGTIFLLLLLCTQLTYELISEPNKLYHLGLWTNFLKELALSGGAFVVAGSFPSQSRAKGYFKLPETLVPYGNLFFLFTIASFGTCHLIYDTFLVSTLPSWWPDHLFWVHFTGVALISAAVAIILGIRIRVVSLLLALMIFLWVWMMHLPSALKSPVSDRGNLLASTFDALAFSGISLLLAFTMEKQAWVSQIENWGIKKRPAPYSQNIVHEKSLQH